MWLPLKLACIDFLEVLRKKPPFRVYFLFTFSETQVRLLMSSDGWVILGSAQDFQEKFTSSLSSENTHYVTNNEFVFNFLES